MLRTTLKKETYLAYYFFIDFEKAFDSLNWNFLLKCLVVFGFCGPSHITWVETFYANTSSCVLNNGFCTLYFELQTGGKTGDPLSPCLFIFAAEILATAIRNRSNIGQDEFKLVQYADDLNVFVPDIESAKRVFELLDLVDLFWFKGQFFQN